MAIPLEAINDASAYDKMPGIGPHPKGIHHWWARLPLPTARALLFASLVNDPSSNEELENEDAVREERERLFGIVRGLLVKKPHKHPEIFETAKKEIKKSIGNQMPAIYDPFCGGGSIPLEAQRLGLKAHASDLNPVAALITKALIEIPPKFAGQPPVRLKKASAQTDHGSSDEKWKGARGLAEDVRYYGNWMRDQAEKRIGHLYPKVKLPKSEGGGEATVIAWLWARTVKCPNPACGGEMPLVSSTVLSKKKGKKAWLEYELDESGKRMRFSVRGGTGNPPVPSKTGRGAKFKCLVCDVAADDQHIKDEGVAGRMHTQLMAIVADGPKGRVYLDPVDVHISKANEEKPKWAPEQELPYEPRAIWCTLYGLKTFKDLFTKRQLVALTTFSDLIGEFHEVILNDAKKAGLPDDDISLEEGGKGARAYADAVAVYLAFAIDRSSDFNNSLCRWAAGNEKIMNLFGRQAIPMVWDFAEANIMGESVGGWRTCFEYVAKCVEVIIIVDREPSKAVQMPVAGPSEFEGGFVLHTDPPYYDNIGYADLSDFFYVWLRQSIGKFFPKVFKTILVPKTEELIASPHRFGGDQVKAKQFFLDGFKNTFDKMRKEVDARFPIAVYYAFKQNEETEAAGSVIRVSTGWETFLESLIQSGFQITATWPIRASQAWRMVSMGTNSLATYVVSVCRVRSLDAPVTTRKDFFDRLRRELPKALHDLQLGNVPPVDLAQALIGPGMAIFSSFGRVVEADGSAMKVRAALAAINQVLDEFFTEQESEYDPDSRWALAWYEQFGLTEGSFGDAETLARAKNVSVNGLVESGILRSQAGKVRLLGRSEYSTDWDPLKDDRLPIWEVTQRLILALERDGERGTASLLQKIGGLGEKARDLAYRVHAMSERKGWAQEALAFNSLVVAWAEITRLAKSLPGGAQSEMFQ